MARRKLARDRKVGAVLPIAALGVVLVALVAWILFAPSDPRLEVDPEPNGVVTEPAAGTGGPEAGVFVEGPAGELPGEGGLSIHLEYLSGPSEDRLRQSRAGSLAGLVSDANGRPAAGVDLRVVGGPQDGLRTATGEDGRYLFEGLVPGTHFISLQSPGGTPVVRLQRILGRAATKRDFQLGGVMEVPFLVRDHENEPLADAEVLTDLGAHRARTGADGIAHVAGVAGGQRVLVDVRAEGYVPVRFEMNLFPGRLGEAVELPALPQGGTLRGQVKSWPGGPLPRVTLVPRASNPGPWLVAWEEWQGIETDAEGRFELEDLPLTHMVDVRVFHPAGIGQPRVRALRPMANVTATAEFVIIESEARVGGKLTDGAGKPVKGARVLLESVDPAAVLGRLYSGLDESPVAVPLPVPAALRRELVTRADGSFDFAVGDHPEGTGHMLLSVEADGYQPLRREVRTTTKSLNLTLMPLDLSSSLALVRGDGGPLPASPPQWESRACSPTRSRRRCARPAKARRWSTACRTAGT